MGPSKTHVHGALFVSFFSYGHLMSLVLEGEQFDALTSLFSEHLVRAFTKSRDVPAAEGDGKTVESNDSEKLQADGSESDAEAARSDAEGSNGD